MSYGPNPWVQQHWDFRAAMNFIGGGAGCGLLIASALAGGPRTLQQACLLLGLALVGVGLLHVWAEIGRPWRALNVFINPGQSWMSREAWVAPWLMLAGAAALFFWPVAAGLAAVLAAAFLYCQARILQASKGIAAWREPRLIPLIVVTGLAEGLGLFVLLAAFWQGLDVGAALTLGGLLLLRLLAAQRWRAALAAGRTPTRTLAACDRALRPLYAGSVVALALLPLALLLPPGLAAAAQALAGLGAALGGGVFKFLLVTRAAFNQGFALPHLPVRGVRRSSATHGATE